jgi:hypothetical protein
MRVLRGIFFARIRDPLIIIGNELLVAELSPETPIQRDLCLPGEDRITIF